MDGANTVEAQMGGAGSVEDPMGGANAVEDPMNGTGAVAHDLQVDLEVGPTGLTQPTSAMGAEPQAILQVVGGSRQVALQTQLGEGALSQDSGEIHTLRGFCFLFADATKSFCMKNKNNFKYHLIPKISNFKVISIQKT